MEKYYYSNKTKGFYIYSIHKENKPKDCVEISLKKYKSLLNIPINKEIVVIDKNVLIKEKVNTIDYYKNKAKFILLSKLDCLAAVMPRNETYSTSSERESFKEKVRSCCKDIREVQLPSLSSKTIAELESIINDKTTVEDLLK